ncbi:MAG: DUF4256 domain-containing protein [Chloroflexota bacterium]
MTTSALKHSDLISTLKNRFEKNMNRHQGIKWEDVQKRLESNDKKLQALAEMERTGGEPDVVGVDDKTGEVLFFDCSPETPKDRRNVCYDRQALDSRKENKPADSAMDMAKHIGIDILTEQQYQQLQQLGEFDLKTSSWLKTPEEIRKLGGAIYGDRRYNHVFTYHNGAISYYAVRGFRGCLKV